MAPWEGDICIITPPAINGDMQLPYLRSVTEDSFSAKNLSIQRDKEARIDYLLNQGDHYAILSPDKHENPRSRGLNKQCMTQQPLP